MPIVFKYPRRRRGTDLSADVIRLGQAWDGDVMAATAAEGEA